MATRFVIVSHPRCGSHMLASALSSRQDVYCAYEPCNSEVRPYGFKPTSFRIWQDVWSQDKLDRFKAVGFILHRDQAGLDGDVNAYGYGIWNRLAGDPTIRIIFVHRVNQLKRYVSNEIAKRTRRWQVYDRCDPDCKSHLVLSVDPDAFAKDVENYQALGRKALFLLRQHETAVANYEEVLSKPDENFVRLQEFLGLEPVKLKPATVKQERRDLPDIVNNYCKLLSRLEKMPGYELGEYEQAEEGIRGGS